MIGRKAIFRKFFLLAVPSSLVALLVGLTIVEIWVRARWDPKRGSPGFFLSDPRLGQRLAPGYSGWFAGVPVRINALGFRDPRDYTIEKPPGTFRILVLGDSVTFGHGATYETTYPFLLEQRLRSWRPEATWEVWNLGVPGYNTANELAYLEEIGPLARPDLVVVGFFENDFVDNEQIGAPSIARRFESSMLRAVQRHLYSYEFYKRVFLTLRWRLAADVIDLKRLEHIATEEALLHQVERPPNDDEQQLTDAEYFDDLSVASFECIGVGDRAVSSGLAEWQQSSSWSGWLAAVRELQRLRREGTYNVVFFVNIAPRVCPGADRFYDGQGHRRFVADLEAVLGEGTPVVSTGEAFMHYRPSQMPFASGHSLGNSNRVKADVLFEFLRDRVLPSSPARPVH